MLDTIKDGLQASLKTFLKYLPHCAFVKDLEGNIVFTNESFLKLSKTSDLAISSLISTNPQITFAENEARNKKSSVENAEVVFTSDLSGTPLWLSFDAMPWEDESGNLLGTIGILRNVSEFKQKTLALAESTNLLTAVIEHLPVRVFWKDHNLNYLGCNTIFANDMGHDTPEQLIGTDDFNTSMTKEEAELCRADDFGVIKTMENRFGIEEVIGSEEDPTWITVNKMPLHNAAGNMIGVLGTYEIINERKQAQIELESSLQREKELNQLKTSFISTVSHEYRNPLAVISSSAQSMLLLNDRMTSEMRKTRLENIMMETKQMTELMEDVLFIGREELLATQKEFIATDITALAEDVLTSIDVGGAEVERIEVVHEGTPEPIICVPIHMSQIVQNLLSNALKYSDDEIKLTFNWESEDFIMQIIDKGNGISEEELPYIFDSFFRSKNIGLIDGNGLGLFIVKRAVDIHQGQITCKSIIDEGTTFTVTLPSALKGK